MYTQCMAITFIGDLHGNFDGIQLWEGVNYIQVGDFGVGFAVIPALPKSFQFIRGNHDDPSLCKQNPHYMGDYGFKKGWGVYYVSGAQSRDWQKRVAGFDKWFDEELNQYLHDDIISSYLESKPKIVVSHDAPTCATGMPNNSATTYLLNKMFELWQPEFWVFGHHHKSIRQEINHTKFIGLAIGEQVTI